MTESSSATRDEMSTIDACIQIEESCAAIYYSFAGIFADLPQFCSLWTEMAIEEEKHADDFRAVKAIHCKHYTCSDIENDLIKMVLDQIKTLNDSFSSKVPSLREALVTALILEKTVEKYHLEVSRQILDPELARLLDVMMEYSHGHKEMLRIAADTVLTSS